MFTDEWEARTQYREGKVPSTQRSVLDATQHDLEKLCMESIHVS